MTTVIHTDNPNWQKPDKEQLDYGDTPVVAKTWLSRYSHRIKLKWVIIAILVCLMFGFGFVEWSFTFGIFSNVFSDPLTGDLETNIFISVASIITLAMFFFIDYLWSRSKWKTSTFIYGIMIIYLMLNLNSSWGSTIETFFGDIPVNVSPLFNSSSNPLKYFFLFKWFGLFVYAIVFSMAGVISSLAARYAHTNFSDIDELTSKKSESNEHVHCYKAEKERSDLIEADKEKASYFEENIQSIVDMTKREQYNSYRMTLSEMIEGLKGGSSIISKASRAKREGKIQLLEGLLKQTDTLTVP